MTIRKVKKGKELLEKLKLSLKRILNKKEYAIVYIIVLIPFTAMMIYFINYVNVDSDITINNVYNPRGEILESLTRRGPICDRNGEILAQTIVNENGKEERIYPHDNLFSHVVGYSTNGKKGIERIANYRLIMSDIDEATKIKNDINGEKNPGNHVISTLDVNLQEVADGAMGVYQGAIVVIEVKTGKVLAMVSKPDFNPNKIEEMWEELRNDNESSVLLNRSIQGLYPPGSTFKILTSLEYISENNNDISSYRYNCNGSIRKEDEKIKCYHGANHGSVDFTESFKKSCNTSFVNVGLSLNGDEFANTLSEVYFGKEMPIELNYKKSVVDISSESTVENVMQTSIGQGTTLVTPMHMAMIAGAIANDGIMMKPYFIDSVRNDAGKVVDEYEPEEVSRVMSEKESDILSMLMEEVVLDGTGHKLSDLSYTAAGKTGSAEYNENPLDSHAWFVGFAPVEEPEIALAVIIEGAGSGGDYAVPMAKRVFDEYFE